MPVCMPSGPSRAARRRRTRGATGTVDGGPGMARRTLHVIGWKEYVEFVDWPLRRVKAKIDTGARTSALDVLSYELHEADDGLTATLRLSLDPRRPERVQELTVPVLKMTVVCNSSGMR